MKNETINEKIKRVAVEIQDILVREKMSMIPTISLGPVEEKEDPILKKVASDILLGAHSKTGKVLDTAEDLEETFRKTPIGQADFMQP